MGTDDSHTCHGTEQQRERSLRLLCNFFARCFGRNSSTVENKVERCECKTSLESERAARLQRVKNWVEESHRPYPNFIHQDGISNLNQSNQSIKSEVYEVESTVATPKSDRRIPAAVNVRRRQARSNNAEPRKGSAIIPEAAPAPCTTSFVDAYLMSRRRDVSPAPIVMPSTEFAPDPVHQPQSKISAVFSWFNPSMCAHKRK
jgi:hypothetical protein